MTDGIVTRLREEPCGETWCDQCKIYNEAADEIERLRKDVAFQAKVISRHYKQSSSMRKETERLRSVISDIQKAVTDEGRSPAHHQQVMRKHRKEWPVLWKAIDKATKGIKK